MSGDQRIPIVLLIDKLAAAGAQTHVYQLATNLGRGRFQPHVFCLTSGGAIADKLVEEGVPVTILGSPRIYDGVAAAAMKRFVGMLRSEKIQVLHTFLTSANVFGTLAGRLAHVPVIVTSRRDDGFARSKRLGLVEEWLINPLADHVVAVSESAAVAARRERALREKVLVVPNGITLRDPPPPERREHYRRELGAGPDDKVIGVVANFNPIKGHVDCVAAAARVIAEMPSARLVLVGDGQLRGDLEEQVRSLGIADRVVMTGSRNDVRDLLSAFDVAALTSYTEGMSNVVLEYMAAGLPVVVTAVGGNVEVIRDRETGRLVPPRDPEALSRALLDVLRDPDGARRMGEAAQRHIREHLTLERMVQRHEELYLDLLGRRARGPGGS